MKRILSVLALLCPFLGACQLIVLHGKVIDEGGGPIAGATIVVKGTARTTVSDHGGLFTLTQTGPADTLVVSAVGYEEREEPTGEQASLTVVLHRKATSLQEVTVSTGYQSLPKERATGSFTHMDNAALNQQVGTGVLERLEGMVNGLMVDRKTKPGGQLLIRGLSTVTGPRDPLIVLDNFPWEGDLASINPNDVESITVLKDAAAASIWGARAGNGVIVITTKKGRYNHPLRVEVASSVFLQEKPDLFSVPQMSSSDFVEVEGYLFSKGYRFSDTASVSRPPFSPVYEILFRQRRGQLTADEAEAQLDALRRRDVRHDFDRYLYQRALNQQYAVNLRGGAGIAAWLLSAGYDRNQSELDARFERVNLRVQNSLRLLKKGELTTALSAYDLRTRGGRPAPGSLRTAQGALPPYTALADDEGRPLPLAKDYRQAFTDSAGGGKLLDWNYYPLEDYPHWSDRTHTQSITADLGLDYPLLRGLSAAVKYRYQVEHRQGELLYGEDSYFARDLINQYTQLNRATGAVTYRVPRGGIRDASTDELTAQNLRGELRYTLNQGVHGVAAFGGAELRETGNRSQGSRAYGYDPDLLQAMRVDYTTAYPQYVTGRSVFIPSGEEYGRTLNRFVSFFGNGAYTWRGKYTLSLSGRKDASNLFGLHTNQKWNPLWSAGAAWEVSREAFYRVGVLPYLKVRATYGYSGNIDPSMSALTTLGYSSLSPYTGTPTARVDKFSDPNLRWERVRLINAAVDFRTAGGRLQGSVEYFLKRSTDLFATVPVDPTAGLGRTSLRKNVATTKGRGVDLELTSVNTRGAVQWTTALNLNAYWDEVVDFYLVSLSGSNFVGEGTTGLKGKSIYSVLAYPWGGLEGATGDPIGMVDGQPSKDYTKITGSGTTIHDLVYIGRGLPPIYGSLGNTLSWKGLSLTARVSWKLGYYFRRSSINYTALFGSGQGHSDYAGRWQKAGDEASTSVPSMVYPANSRRDAFYSGSEVLVERGDHLRLQYVNLSYVLDKSRWPRLPLQQAQLYVVASNLGVLWRANNLGLDPDYPPPGLPPALSLAMGLRVTL